MVPFPLGGENMLYDFILEWTTMWKHIQKDLINQKRRDWLKCESKEKVEWEKLFCEAKTKKPVEEF